MRNLPNAMHSWPKHTKLWKQGHCESCGVQILSAKSDATAIENDFFARFLLLYSRDPDKQTSRDNDICQIWKFRRKCHQQNENPVMLGHHDDETRHVSCDSRKFPFLVKLDQSQFYAFIWTVVYLSWGSWLFADNQPRSGLWMVT